MQAHDRTRDPATPHLMSNKRLDSSTHTDRGDVPASASDAKKLCLIRQEVATVQQALANAGSAAFTVSTLEATSPQLNIRRA